MLKPKSNTGWGWRIEGECLCPSFGNRGDAQKYCDLRNAGMTHLEAWDKVESESYLLSNSRERS